MTLKIILKIIWGVIFIIGAVVGQGCHKKNDTDSDDSAMKETSEDSSAVLACDPATPESLAECVERQNYVDWLSAVAIQRPPGSDGWQKVQDLCATELERFGYQVQRQHFQGGTNVIGRIPGKSDADAHVIVSAHYDHIEDCTGADDNGSGVAGLLETARVLSLMSHKKSLIAACWDQEENGYLGSKQFVADAVESKMNIELAFVYEMIGYINVSPNSQHLPDGFDQLFPDAVSAIETNDSRADFAAILANQAAGNPGTGMTAFANNIGLPAYLIVVPDELQQLSALSDLRRSDHASFWSAGFPAINITDTANMRYAGYHCEDEQDAIKNLNNDFTTRIIRSTVFAASTALNQ